MAKVIKEGILPNFIDYTNCRIQKLLKGIMNLYKKCALTNPNVKGTANEGHVSNKKHKMSRGKIMNLRQIYEVVKNVLDLYGDWRCKDRFHRFYRFQEIIPFFNVIIYFFTSLHNF